MSKLPSSETWTQRSSADTLRHPPGGRPHLVSGEQQRSNHAVSTYCSCLQKPSWRWYTLVFSETQLFYFIFNFRWPIHEIIKIFNDRVLIYQTSLFTHFLCIYASQKKYIFAERGRTFHSCTSQNITSLLFYCIWNCILSEQVLPLKNMHVYKACMCAVWMQRNVGTVCFMNTVNSDILLVSFYLLRTYYIVGCMHIQKHGWCLRQILGSKPKKKKSQQVFIEKNIYRSIWLPLCILGVVIQ